MLILVGGMNMQNQYDLELAEDKGWKVKESRIRTFSMTIRFFCKSRVKQHHLFKVMPF